MIYEVVSNPCVAYVAEIRIIVSQGLLEQVRQHWCNLLADLL